MKYLVALQVGGIMEQPHFTYQDIQEIEADSKEEAVKLYNSRNKCNYFYGTVVGQDGVQTTFNEPVKHNSFG